MDSVIFYQPRQIPVPAFREKAIRSPTFRYAPVTVSGRQSWVAEQRSEWDKTLKAHNVMEVVHLTGLDQGQGPVLEQRAAGDNPARVQGNSTAVKDDRVRKGTDGAGGDDDDEDFPSIASILSGKKRKGAVVKTAQDPKHTTTEQLVDDGSSKGDCADAGAGAGASGARRGDSQDKPIELDDDGPDDHKPHGVTPDDGDRGLDATRTSGQPGSSPSLSGPPSQIINLNNSNGQNINDEVVDNRERSGPAAYPGYDRSSPQGALVKDGSDHASAVRGAPVSAGHIHDVFAEYDQAFGKARMGRGNPKLQQRSSTSHRSDSAPRRSITSDRAAAPSHSEASQKAHGQLDLDKSVLVDACADTLPSGDAPTVDEAEHARQSLGKAGLQSYDANHSDTQPKGSQQSRKRSMASLPSSYGRTSKRSRSSASPTPSVSETDRRMSSLSKQADGSAGKATTTLSSFTGLGSHNEEYLPSVSVETVQDLGPPPALVPEDNQYAVERLLESRVRRLGGRNRRQVTQYLVKWEGYGNEHNSWVDETDIHEGLIKAYAASTVSTAGRPG